MGNGVGSGVGGNGVGAGVKLEPFQTTEIEHKFKNNMLTAQPAKCNKNEAARYSSCRLCSESDHFPARSTSRRRPCRWWLTNLDTAARLAMPILQASLNTQSTVPTCRRTVVRGACPRIGDARCQCAVGGLAQGALRRKQEAVGVGADFAAVGQAKTIGGTGCCWLKLQIGDHVASGRAASKERT